MVLISWIHAGKDRFTSDSFDLHWYLSIPEMPLTAMMVIEVRISGISMVKMVSAARCINLPFPSIYFGNANWNDGDKGRYLQDSHGWRKIASLLWCRNTIHLLASTDQNDSDNVTRLRIGEGDSMTSGIRSCRYGFFYLRPIILRAINITRIYTGKYAFAFGMYRNFPIYLICLFTSEMLIIPIVIIILMVW